LLFLLQRKSLLVNNLNYQQPGCAVKQFSFGTIFALKLRWVALFLRRIHSGKHLSFAEPERFKGNLAGSREARMKITN